MTLISIRSSLILACGLILQVSMIATPAHAAISYQIVHSFVGSDGRVPSSNLTFDSQGNAYGTTAAGGDFDLGTVFQLSFANGQWTETVLYSFAGGTDGSDPHGGVVIDSAGNLYGTTVAGGIGGICAGDGCGTVFELSPSGGSWTESILYNFTGGNDGAGPGNGLVFDNAGNLYGTTPNGGKFSAGTIYKLSPTKTGVWKERVIHAFTGGKDGSNGSLGRLVFDAAGNIYGIAELGGANGFGTVYKLAPKPSGGWNFATLHAFQGMPDAAFPYGGVVLDSAGNLYGTTYYGGSAGMGTVYQLSQSPFGTWQETVLYSFQGGRDASLPTSTLVFRAGGALYGTSTTGGRPSCDCGTVFRLAPHGVGWKESVVHRFGVGHDGQSPNYEVTFDGAGNVYGTTPVGGAGADGIVFEVSSQQ
jgi:uncharacterized repeat protein (TIGR03803 family)